MSLVSQGEDVIYKVSVERWPLQQLPPVASDGIITPFWCIAQMAEHTFYYIHSHICATQKNTSVDAFANDTKQQKCVCTQYVVSMIPTCMIVLLSAFFFRLWLRME